MITDALTIARAYWPIWLPLALTFLWWASRKVSQDEDPEEEV